MSNFERWVRDYYAERLGAEFCIGPSGFIVYRVDGDIITIEELYVEPESRKTGAGQALVNYVTDIGRSRGCDLLQGCINTNTHNADNLKRLYTLGGCEFSGRTLSGRPHMEIWSKLI